MDIIVSYLNLEFTALKFDSFRLLYVSSLFFNFYIENLLFGLWLKLKSLTLEWLLETLRLLLLEFLPK